MAQAMRKDFWSKYPLDELTPEEWEALCDGCGKCCLLKLEDADTGEVAYTNVGCRLLDPDTCRCGNYPLRKQLVRTCIQLTPDTLEGHLYWMPQTCAYRLRANGARLPDWHPLVSGSPDSVHESGMSMAGRIVPEYEVDEEDLEDYVIEGEF
ncbi:YcgN family cysteine cluster protein [Oceanomicrobium pacificus]|uniref:UPF0260 protein GSH16_02170 n=1 Tax=Oceanomicrobium pacificus TaxID=2692916 RepID=A0A6B0TIP3_9RHOB|nr:YcgN family cysteine cluster protein [Oceanomicrobium pacificus]MXU64237.1 YcgN family cysteine cluster protein [Oceanomicrobium pacificus]